MQFLLVYLLHTFTKCTYFFFQNICVLLKADTIFYHNSVLKKIGKSYVSFICSWHNNHHVAYRILNLSSAPLSYPPIFSMPFHNESLYVCESQYFISFSLKVINRLHSFTDSASHTLFPISHTYKILFPSAGLNIFSYTLYFLHFKIR